MLQAAICDLVALAKIERLQVRQPLQMLQAVICDSVARIKIERLQILQSTQMLQAVICDLVAQAKIKLVEVWKNFSNKSKLCISYHSTGKIQRSYSMCIT